MIDLQELAKWITVLGIIGGLIWRIGYPLASILVKLNKHLEKAEADELGLRTLLKYRLTIVSKRVLNRDGMTLFERTVLDDGLKAYEGLDGNGEVHALVDLALQKPVVPDFGIPKEVREQIAQDEEDE